VISNIRRN